MRLGLWDVDLKSDGFKFKWFSAQHMIGFIGVNLRFDKIRVSVGFLRCGFEV